MGTTPLRLFLQSLCCNSYWNYAVFWKLQHQRQMLLTWEDGYCDIPKQRDSMESILLDNICFKGSDEIFSSTCGQWITDGNSDVHPIGLAVADMSSVQYALGEGFVGEVAYTGNYHWVFSDNLLAGEFHSNIVPECPDEWLFQFAAGIKTLLLVPVVPHGVLQLGSLEKVAEDLAMVAYVRDNFHGHQNVVGYSAPFTSNRELLHLPPSSSLMSTFMENLDELSAVTINGLKTEDSKAVDCVKPPIYKFSTRNLSTPPCKTQDFSHITGEDMLKNLNGVVAHDLSFQPMDLIEVSQPLHQSLNFNKVEMMESNMFRFSCLEEEEQAFPYSNDYNMGVFGEYANKTMNTYSDKGMMEQPLVDNNAGQKNGSDFFSFPTDCELQKVLGSVFNGQTNENLWDSSVSVGEKWSTSRLVCGNLISGTRPSAERSSEWLVKADDAEHLLEAVVATVCNGPNEDSCNRTSSLKSSMTSSGQFSDSSNRQSQSERSAILGENKVSGSHVKPALVDRRRNAITSSSPSVSSLESVMSALIEEQQQNKGHGHQQPMKGSKLSSASKRRARPGDNQQRPRPRDRQLIQDRVKELRELVPNGAKCSIDGLLDRTIKLMSFFRSVTDQADKLRQCVHEEVVGQKNLESFDTKGGCQNGRSWAFELGSEQRTCPIIVEDLEYPGRMLIEMLCDDHGRFLEIAETISRLQLTILKGVVERYSDDSWAHFIIEVPRGFHRLDIFWPLMQLLQQNRNPIASKI